MAHYVEVCEYGHVHGQCRCADPNKAVRKVTCDNPQHAQRPNLGKHGMEYAEPPEPALRFAVTFDGGVSGTAVTAGPFRTREDADDWSALAGALVASSESDFIAMIDPEEALEKIRTAAQPYTWETPREVVVHLLDDYGDGPRRFDAEAIASMPGQEFPITHAFTHDRVLAPARCAVAEQGEDALHLTDSRGPRSRRVDRLAATWDKDHRATMGFRFDARTGPSVYPNASPDGPVFCGPTRIMEVCPWMEGGQK